MRIAVFGLGYVGVVTAACLAREGHSVWGIDKDPHKVDLLNRGESPIVEEKIGEIVRAMVEAGKLRASLSCEEVVAQSDIALVCVGTPSLPNGALDTHQLEQVAAEIGTAVRDRPTPYLVVVRSTVLPGTIRSVVAPVLCEASGANGNSPHSVVFHPEFLREGSSVFDFYNPPKIVVGADDRHVGEQVMDLYEGVDAPRFVTALETAEAIKYCDNLFHAVKVTFANEVGQFCQSVGVDSAEAMEIFCADTKLNISAKYLRPGFAFGGSCLPKDLRAFLSSARQRDVRVPMLESVLVSNTVQIERALSYVLGTGCRRVGMFGLAFKPGTDDLRESPLVELAERLLGKGLELTCFDEQVRVARLIGGNRAYVEKVLPHLADLLTDDLDALRDCELILVGHPAGPDLLADWLDRGAVVYDLSGGQEIEHPAYQRVV